MLQKILSYSPNEAIHHVINYTQAKYYPGKDSYIGFQSFDPIRKKMRRKRIRLNFMSTEKERKARAKGLCAKFNEMLASGWSPWIDSNSKSEYADVNDSLECFITYYKSMEESGVIRHTTLEGYVNVVNMLKKFNMITSYKVNGIDVNRTPIQFMDEFNRTFLNSFIDYIFIVKGNSARSRNNYITQISTICDFLIDRGLLKTNPAKGIKKIPKNRMQDKNRNILSKKDLDRLFGTLKENDKKYLLACHFIYFCFVRPIELYRIKVEYINIDTQTLFIPHEISKNRKDGYVTIPDEMIELLKELKITDYNSDCYVFGKGMETCKTKGNDKQFAEYWSTWVRGHWLTDFDLKYKFYSLKDTGITNMLRAGYPNIVVRDQARHCDMSVTNIYTPDSSKVAPASLRSFSTKTK